MITPDHIPQTMEVRDWLLVISMIGHFSYTLYSYVDRRGDKTSQRIAELTEKIGLLDKDVTTLKAKVDAAPSHDHLAEFYGEIRDTNEKVDQLIGETKQQSKVIELIHGYLMERGKN